MGRRRGGRLAEEYESRLQGVVACVTRQVLVGRQDDGPRRRLLLQRGQAVQTASGERLRMRVELAFAVVPDPDVGERVRTEGYFYDVAELRELGEEQEIVGYHWNPEAREGEPSFPHVHVYGGRVVDGKHVSKMHLPTGRVSLEAFVRFLITELDVVPLRAGWEDVLREAELFFAPRRLS